MSPRLPFVVCLLALMAVHAVASTAYAGKPKQTPVNVETTPPGAEVTQLEPAPEKLLGLTPLKKVKLVQGPLKLRMRLAGYEDKIETLTVGPKETTFSFALVRKIVPATLDLTGDANSLGADVLVDGENKGKLPVKVSVPPGKHQIIVRKAGCVTWEKWTEVSENQAALFEIALKAQDKPKGSILVSSTPAGAEVRVNGAPKGKAPTLIENVEPGAYEVELSLEGSKPYRQTVTVGEGKRETVSGTLEPLVTAPVPVVVAAPATGELTVLCDAPKAVIAVDGEDKGGSPAKLSGLKPGEHLVECTAPSYPKTAQVVIVKAGEVKTVQLSPRAAVAASRGSVSVVSNVPNARAKVGDGETKKVPCQFDDLPPGNHQVTVMAEGYATETKTVAVEATKVAELKVELKAMGKIKVTLPPGKRGNVYVDGEIKGQAPITLDLPVGAHKLEIREDGTGASVESHDVPVVAGQTAIIEVKLVEPPPPKVVRRSNPTSAHVNDEGKGTIMLGVGFPTFFQGTVMAGVADNVAAGLEIRNTLHLMTEFELLGQYRIFGSNAFALGVQGGFGGGLGLNDRNSFTASGKAIASLLLGDSAAFSFFGHIRFFSDQGIATPGKRDQALLLPIGLQGEVKFSAYLNLWAKVEMDFFEKKRKLYDDLTGGLNSKIRGGVGITWLFN